MNQVVTSEEKGARIFTKSKLPFLKSRPKSFPVIANIAACVAISFTLAVMHYENYVPASFIGAYNTLLLILFAFTWLWLSYKCGKHGKWQFMLFTSLYWILPMLTIFLDENGPGFIQMSVTAYLLAEWSRLLILTPIQIVGGLFGISDAASVIAMILFCGIAYLIGMFIVMGREKKVIR